MTEDFHDGIWTDEVCELKNRMESSSQIKLDPACFYIKPETGLHAEVTIKEELPDNGLHIFDDDLSIISSTSRKTCEKNKSLSSTCDIKSMLLPKQKENIDLDCDDLNYNEEGEVTGLMDISEAFLFEDCSSDSVQLETSASARNRTVIINKNLHFMKSIKSSETADCHEGLYVENDSCVGKNDNFTCKLCDMKFEDRALFEVHHGTCATALTFSGDNSHGMSQSQKFLTNHLHSPVEGKITDFSNRVVESNDDKSKNFSNSYPKKSERQKNIVCYVCNKTFNHSHELTTHSNIHKDEEFQCHVCDKVFSRKQTFMIHMNKHKNKQMPKTNKSLKSSQSDLVIHPSENSTSKDNNDNSKTIGRKNKKRFKCSVCDKSYLTSLRLAKHLNLAHEDKKYELKCDFCDKTFIRQDHLAEHTKMHYDTKKTLKCEVCGMLLSSSFNLKRHLLVHFQEKRLDKEKDFSCDTCGKCFLNKSDLSRHGLTHSGEKLFKCQRCESSFTQASSLARHILIHTEEKKFKCSVCSKKFSRKYMLTIHKLSHR